MSDLISRQDAIDAFGLSEKTRKYGGDHSGYNTMMLYEIQDILEGLPSAEPEPHWIPCSERLPKTNEVVLLCGKYDIFCGYHNTKGKWYSIIGDGWETGMDFPSSNKGDILAWMPLPEPYSIESDGIKEEKR